MPVKIRQTPYQRMGGPNVGPYNVFPDDVRAHLGVIAMAGTQELPDTLGEDPDPNDATLTVISYNPGPQDATTTIGRIRQLLKDLVDRGSETIIFGVGPDFVWDDGSSIEASAGGEIGDWVFYDTQNCDGDGRWVRGTDGNEVCTTSAGILFHELGHVHLNHPVGTVDEDERAAVGVENDLRTAQGLVPRDPNHWPESDCGCPDGGCCIVASVATGSPYSPQVHALRRLRDYRLRTTRFGHYLFEVLHEEYYTFSVPICRIMVMNRVTQKNVADWLVKPLIRSFQLLAVHEQIGDNVEALGESIRTDHEQNFLAVSEELTWEDLRQLLIEISRGEINFGKLQQLDPGTQKVIELLAGSLPKCPHIRWGIVDLLIIYATARSRYQSTSDQLYVGKWLKDALDEWMGNVPLEDILDEISPGELIGELPQLATTLLTRPLARERFAARLLSTENFSTQSNLIEQLRDGGYIS